MAKSSATTTSTLHLNNEGGNIILGPGQLTINAGGNFLNKKCNIYQSNPTVTKGVNPSQVIYWLINNCDKNGAGYSNCVGQFETSLQTTGEVRTYIRARQHVASNASSMKTAELRVTCYQDGTMRGDCNCAFYGAVWNDYAEFRDQQEEVQPGYCIASQNNGKVLLTTERLQASDGIVSDTYGFAIGETDDCRTPIAVSGRVLAYCEGNRYDYNAGDTVCATAGGLVSKMTRDEIMRYPDRIVGIVSEIPEYEEWGTGNVKVDGRIWIKI